MSTIDVGYHTASQFFVVVISGFMSLYFAVEYYGNRVGWEVVYVSSVEAICYFLSAVIPDPPLFGPTDSPMLRYVSWLLCCPVLIKVMFRIVSASVATAEQVDGEFKAMIADMLMIICGVIGAFYDDTITKMLFFTSGCVFLFHVIQQVGKRYRDNIDLIVDLQSRQYLMAIMLCSWAMFPILYLLSPEMSGAISRETSIILHSFGDLFSKNFYSFMACRLDFIGRGASDVVKHDDEHQHEIEITQLDEVDEDIYDTMVPTTDTPISMNRRLGGGGEVIGVDLKSFTPNTTARRLQQRRNEAALSPGSRARRLQNGRAQTALSPGSRARRISALSPGARARRLQSMSPGSRQRTLAHADMIHSRFDQDDDDDQDSPSFQGRSLGVDRLQRMREEERRSRGDRF